LEDQRESFVFYRSFYEVSNSLSNENKAELFTMICELALNRTEITSDKPILNQFFTLIKPQINANYRKATFGSKGGRPKKKP
jgi:hypothetical protein